MWASFLGYFLKTGKIFCDSFYGKYVQANENYSSFFHMCD